MQKEPVVGGRVIDAQKDRLQGADADQEPVFNSHAAPFCIDHTLLHLKLC